MNGQNYTNFKSNLAIMVNLISLSSLNSIGQSIFELESGNENVDTQMDVGHSDDQSTRRVGYTQPTHNPPKNVCKDKAFNNSTARSQH